MGGAEILAAKPRKLTGCMTKNQLGSLQLLIGDTPIAKLHALPSCNFLQVGTSHMCKHHGDGAGEKESTFHFEIAIGANEISHLAKQASQALVLGLPSKNVGHARVQQNTMNSAQG